MKKYITGLLLCLLLCFGAMIPLVSEMVQLWHLEATQPSHTTQPSIQLDAEAEEPPKSSTEQDSNVKFYGPDDLIYNSGSMIIKNYITGYGVASEGKLDWQGMYFPYTGGQMELELFLQANGMLTEGVAIMLFLNGRPQPFALGESRTAYQHTVYPGRGETGIGVSFIPVSGVQGETMELCVLYYPSYGASAAPAGNRAWYQERAAKFFLVRMEMEADPPEAEFPEVTQRLVEYNVSEQYAPPSQHDYWSIICNGKYVSGSITLNTNPMLLDLQYTLYSGSQTAYALTIYVDDEPVLYFPWMPETEKADYSKLIQARIDCLDLREGAHTVFALLLKQHYWVYGSGWEDYPDEDQQLMVIHIQTQ